ncbi:MAG: hypothetical protein IJV62_04150, partial [Eggerthellaceae bacterium]|nr:hypothetical protein [Eggerthellaceae bacterium]
FMTHQALKKVQPGPDHMSSDLSLVIITEHMDAHAEQLVQKYRFRKTYGFFGVRGWSDLRLAVVDVANARVVTNGAGKKMIKAIQPNINLGLHNNQ